MSHQTNDYDNQGNNLGHSLEGEIMHSNDMAAESHIEHNEHKEHEHTLYAEPVFNIGNFPVTNSLLTSWLAVFLIIILSLAVRIKLKKVPGVFQGAIEKIIEGALEMMDLVTNDRKKSEKVFPVVFSIFIFILINNWLGLLPGIGSITLNGVPMLRGGTADLNMTLALGLFSVAAANIFGIIMVGGWNYFNKFVNIKAILAIPGKVIKEPTVVLVNPINFFVGLIEIISEIAKVASLSFRLFGNVFAGEVLLASISAIIAFGMPLPFIFLEIIIGIVQALIFAVLTLVYFTIASMEHEAH